MAGHNEQRISAIEEALRKAQAMLEETGRMAKVGGWELDVDTMELVWSAETYRIHQVDPDFNPNLDTGISFYSPEVQPVIAEAVRQAIEDGKPFDVELPFITARGNHLWVHAIGRALQEGGRTRKVYGTFQDITDRKTAEEALRRSEAKFHTLYDSTSDAVILLDQKGFFDCNHAALTIFGCASCEEFCSKHPADLSPPEQPGGTDSMTLANQRIAAALEEGSNHFEWVHQRADTGETFPADVLLSAMELDGKPVLQAVVRDITESKRAEEALRESEARVGRKLNAILKPEGDTGALELSDIIDHEAIQSLMDDFYRLTDMGVAVVDMEGEVLVATGWQDICTRFHRVHPETRRFCMESDTALLEGVEPGGFKLYRCKNGMWDMATPITVGANHVGNLFLGQFFFDDETPDRELFRRQARQYGFDEQDYLAALDRVPRWSREKVDTVMAFYTKFAGMVSSLGHGRITLAQALAKKDRLLDELRESEEKFLNAFLFNPAMMGISRLEDGRYIDINETFTRILGYSREEVLGRTPVELGIYANSQDRQAIKEELLKNGSVQDVETLIMTKAGERRNALLSAVAMELQGEKCLISTVLDITERKRTELELEGYRRNLEGLVEERTSELEGTLKELERSNAELEQFAYVASHDLQEPLRMVASYVQLLQKRYQGRLDADADEFIGYASEGATRMQQLIQDLLAYSRVGTRGKPFEPTDCGEVLSEALVNLRLALEDSGAEVTHDSLPLLKADDLQLVQLFQNLVSNALKFRTGEPPRIHISAVRQEEEWLFSVADNGIGIEAEHAERVFQVFQRLHGREEYPGTGIGLAICRKIVERHGGRIWVEPREGGGSTFYFTLLEKGA